MGVGMSSGNNSGDSKPRSESKMVHQCPNDDDFKQKVAAAGSKPIVVDFTASWCGPCQRIAPVFSKLSETYGDKVVFLKVDVDVCEATSAEFGIRAMPTFLILIDGKKVDDLCGADEEALEAMIKKYA